MTQTLATIRANLLSDEIMHRANEKDRIEVWSQDDDGEWHSHTFGNEAAAVEFEAKGRKRGFPTRRGA